MPASDQRASLSRYMLIPRTLIFLTRGSTVLLLKGAPHKRLFANRYNGVGGHIEQGEDVLSAARREVEEETGLKPDQLSLVGTVIIATGQNPGIGVFIFRGECSDGEPISSPEGTPEWIACESLSEFPLVEDLYILLPRVLDTQPGDPPFSAHFSYNQQGQMIIRFAGD